jgi:hypothetical protein
MTNDLLHSIETDMIYRLQTGEHMSEIKKMLEEIIDRCVSLTINKQQPQMATIKIPLKMPLKNFEIPPKEVSSFVDSINATLEYDYNPTFLIYTKCTEAPMLNHAWPTPNEGLNTDGLVSYYKQVYANVPGYAIVFVYILPPIHEYQI